MDLPDGYAALPASLDDVPAVAAVLLADDLLDTGQSDYDEDFVRNWWSSPGSDPAEDAWIVVAPGGEVIGSGSVIPDGETVLKSWGVVHPMHRGLGIGSAILDSMEARAVERLRGVSGASFHHSINDVDEAARSMVPLMTPPALMLSPVGSPVAL